MTDLSDISPRQCCFLDEHRHCVTNSHCYFLSRLGKKKEKKKMVDLPPLVSEHFGSCHIEKKGKEKVGIDLQEDGHLSVCTLVLKL